MCGTCRQSSGSAGARSAVPPVAQASPKVGSLRAWSARAQGGAAVGSTEGMRCSSQHRSPDWQHPHALELGGNADNRVPRDLETQTLSGPSHRCLKEPLVIPTQAGVRTASPGAHGVRQPQGRQAAPPFAEGGFSTWSCLPSVPPAPGPSSALCLLGPSVVCL